MSMLKIFKHADNKNDISNGFEKYIKAICSLVLPREFLIRCIVLKFVNGNFRKTRRVKEIVIFGNIEED